MPSDEIRRCHWCRRILGDNDHDWHRVFRPDGSVADVCDPCWQSGDEGVEIPLDYTEDDDD